MISTSIYVEDDAKVGQNGANGGLLLKKNTYAKDRASMHLNIANVSIWTHSPDQLAAIGRLFLTAADTLRAEQEKDRLAEPSDLICKVCGFKESVCRLAVRNGHPCEGLVSK